MVYGQIILPPCDLKPHWKIYRFFYIKVRVGQAVYGIVEII